MEEEKKLKIIKIFGIVSLVLFGLFSVTGLNKWLSSPETYTSIITYLDGQKATVTELAAASAGASAAITLLPGDAGSSIANGLADLSTKFLIVLTALYLEKYLLTIIGYFVTKFLIPAACILWIIYLVRGKKMWADFGFKMVVFLLAMMLVIPSGIKVSQMIEETYHDSIQQTISSAAAVAEDIEGIREETQEETEESQVEPEAPQTEETESGWLESILNVYDSVKDLSKKAADTLSETASTVIEGITEIPETVTGLLNRFIEALAILIITSCLIPLLIVSAFVWIVQLIFGIHVEFPDLKRIPGKTGFKHELHHEKHEIINEKMPE